MTESLVSIIESTQSASAETFKDAFPAMCASTFGVRTQFLPRVEWDTHAIAVGTRDRTTIFLPEDLTPWDMGEIIANLDYGRMKESGNKDNLAKLIQTLKDSGIYLAKRLPKIQKGRDLAGELASYLYNFGDSLEIGKKRTIPFSIEAISRFPLSQEKTADIDQFLAGENVNGRLERLASIHKKKSNDTKMDSEIKEEVRCRALSKIFAKMANPENDLSSKIARNINEFLSIPQSEIITGVFREAIDSIAQYTRSMPEGNRNNLARWLLGDEILKEKLNTGQMRRKLEIIKREGSPQQVAQQELLSALQIQREVSRFSRKQDTFSSEKIVKNQELNCVGASILGGALMKEAGINYLVGSLPGHSTLFVITSDNKVFRVEMLADLCEELTDDMFDNNGQTSTQTVRGVLEFAKMKPQNLALGIKINEGERWMTLGKTTNSTQKTYFLPPERGQLVQLIYNIGCNLYEEQNFDKAISCLTMAAKLNKDWPPVYFALSSALLDYNKPKQALEMIQIGRRAEPDNPYYSLQEGACVEKLGNLRRAWEIYEGVKLQNPLLAYPYLHLAGLYESMGLYQLACDNQIKFLSLNESGENIDSYRRQLSRLQEKIAGLK